VPAGGRRDGLELLLLVISLDTSVLEK
jgi:hypothetical protein